MKVRKLDSDGDMVFGHGDEDFYKDSAEGVAQNARTRLQLWWGQWFLDTSEGTPWLEKVLGKQSAADIIVRERILGTPGVKEITSFESVADPDTRTLSFTAEISTVYGSTEVEGTFS